MRSNVGVPHKNYLRIQLLEYVYLYSFRVNIVVLTVIFGYIPQNILNHTLSSSLNSL